MGHTKIMINQMKPRNHNYLYCLLRDKVKKKENQGGWIRMTLASHSISRICLIDCVESSVELAGLSLEGNVARMTRGEENNTCNQLLYEASGAHTCFPGRYCLWLILGKVLGRAFLESILFG